MVEKKKEKIPGKVNSIGSRIRKKDSTTDFLWIELREVTVG